MPLPLVERSEKEIAKTIKSRVEGLKHVRGCRRVTVRMSRKRLDVNLFIFLDGNLALEESHRTASEVEREVKKLVPNARVIIHTEPLGDNHEKLWKLVKGTADIVPGSRGAHNVHIQKIDGKLCVDFHLEVGADMTVKGAHEVADQVEERLKEADPDISEVIIHLESASDIISSELTGSGHEIESHVEHIVKRFPEIKAFQEPVLRRVGVHLHLVLRCNFDPNISIEKAHEISNKIEAKIKDAHPNIDRIDIHEEPY
ncbi:MAG: hypothetical protein M1503_12975 [Thaumarchaeota archaeon]|nr:hypothetical protein [Nitrososphaerota archaeon]MCL5319151.1 hypothetical protein [Nitrososphaerota archaeon]